MACNSAQGTSCKQGACDLTMHSRSQPEIDKVRGWCKQPAGQLGASCKQNAGIADRQAPDSGSKCRAARSRFASSDQLFTGRCHILS